MTKYDISDEDYAFIFQKVPRLCLDFIIVKDGKVLLAKREINPYKGFWSLPGGRVRYKETLEQASKRILKNELELEPASTKMIGYVEFLDEVNKDNVKTHSVSIVLLTKVLDGEISGSDQATEIEFFKALPENTHPDHKKFIESNWDAIFSN